MSTLPVLLFGASLSHKNIAAYLFDGLPEEWIVESPPFWLVVGGIVLWLVFRTLRVVSVLKSVAFLGNYWCSMHAESEGEAQSGRDSSKRGRITEGFKVSSIIWEKGLSLLSWWTVVIVVFQEVFNEQVIWDMLISGVLLLLTRLARLAGEIELPLLPLNYPLENSGTGMLTTAINILTSA